MKTLILAILISSTTQAKESWFCTEGSSERIGHIINACGIGEAESEQAARYKALDSARVEFEKICSQSSDCDKRAIIIVPKRTTCEETIEGVKCYRMISYQLTNDNKSEKSTRAKNAPKIGKGLSRDDLFAYYGKPFTVRKGNSNILIYNNEICISSVCTIKLENNKVVGTHSVKIELTDILD